MYPKKLKQFLLLLAALFSCLCSTYATEKIRISGHPQYPPINWRENNKIVGVGTKIAERIFTELNIPFDIEYTGPWARVQNNARTGMIDVIIGAYINSERTKYMDYTIPYLSDPVAIFVLKGHSFPFDTWNDLINKKGCTSFGESFGNVFDKFIKEKLNIKRVYNNIQNFERLENGKSQYAILGLYPGLICAAKNGYLNKIEILPKYVKSELFYMTFSKKSKYKYLIPKVNRILKKLIDSGQIKKWSNEELESRGIKINIDNYTKAASEN